MVCIASVNNSTGEKIYCTKVDGSKMTWQDGLEALAQIVSWAATGAWDKSNPVNFKWVIEKS